MLTNSNVHLATAFASLDFNTVTLLGVVYTASDSSTVDTLGSLEGLTLLEEFCGTV